MPAITWDSKVATVAGRSASKIEKAFGFRTVGDLLQHYPRRYVEKGRLSGGAVTEGEHVTVIGRVLASKQVQYADRRRGGFAYRLEVIVETEDTRLMLTFFDKRKGTAQWRRGAIVEGSTGLFSGKVGRFRDTWQLTNPQTRIFTTDSVESGHEQAMAAWDSVPELIPLYPATATVQTWALQDAVALALDLVEEVPDAIPEPVRKEHGLIDARAALEGIHRPGSWAEKAAAEQRLRFDEAFVTQVVLAQRRARLQRLEATPRSGRVGGILDRFDQRLPFELTQGQAEIGDRILADLAAGHPMHRLLQGEVGSGKTLVALRAMLRVVDSGAQAALLAPTEVLAQQHHRSITTMLGDLADGGMLGGAESATRVALVTGSQSTAQRKEALLDAASGAAGIVVGTHALLEETVQFADLGLVVVDEQHRFGVEQRATLAAKAGGTPPHVLVMTATPIPRTVAMTVFGDLETSELRELPAGRAPIQSTVVPMLERPEWIDRVWGRIREETEQGRQTYLVCPRISRSEADADDAGDPDDASGPSGPPDPGLAAVEEVAPMLASGPLQGLRVEALHGRMPPEHKDAVMRAFAAGDVDVLVSTTVIEVGVDVPRASVMVILDADRFGVSQLHQLRGRVGRGGLPGLCLLLTRAQADSPARERLEAVAATTDGFALSRIDLEQRREGDVLGAAQSGRRSGLRLLSVIRDGEVIEQARASAAHTVGQDPDLTGHPPLAEAVRRLAESEQADYLEKA
ncbi:MAG TPA: ATP-dependent DNA helicase RecG [Nocardioidaceae bacterium]|nr:ATP-dependent DNA helicase RecG [Nocardioidaceae bacterium]